MYLKLAPKAKGSKEGS
ncbi:hypothetical protein CGLO_14818 [Colletotrichum gloeosporioides Cg-14]|uniref:Uncharacterized protein n=1 Tax=Colletotrichum gloeosporioides (strain Cg-14) TaxID=1237896 RepID=T0L3C9_COLGC|nr:hypothetical protein CGLO_14818 [Colletotrichum gloeosporioides Cg-14]